MLVTRPVAYPRHLSALQDLRLPLPPRCLHTPKHTSRKPPAYPQVSTITPNVPFSLQPNRHCRTHNDPRSDPSVYVRVNICRTCFTDTCSPTRSPPAIGSTGTPTSFPPHRLPRCPYTCRERRLHVRALYTSICASLTLVTEPTARASRL